MINILIFQMLLSINSLTTVCNPQTNSSYIPIIVQSNIEVYNNEGVDLLDELKIRFNLKNTFENMEGVKVVGNDPSQHDGLFLLIFNVTKLPGSELYTLNFSESVNFTCDTINPNNAFKLWSFKEHLQVIVDDPLDNIEKIALLFEENSVKPMLDVINDVINSLHH